MFNFSLPRATEEHPPGAKLSERGHEFETTNLPDSGEIQMSYFSVFLVVYHTISFYFISVYHVISMSFPLNDELKSHFEARKIHASLQPLWMFSCQSPTGGEIRQMQPIELRGRAAQKSPWLFERNGPQKMLLV